MAAICFLQYTLHCALTYLHLYLKNKLCTLKLDFKAKF